MTRIYTEQELAAAVRSTGLGIDAISRLIEQPPTWTCYRHYISGIVAGQPCPDCDRELASLLCDCGKGEWCPEFGSAFAAALKGGE